MALNRALIGTTIESIVEFPAVKHPKYETVRFQLKSITKMPPDLIGECVKLVDDHLPPTNDNVLHLSSSRGCSSVRKKYIRGTTLLGDYEIRLEQSGEMPIVMTIRADHAIKSLLPKRTEAAEELLYALISSPDRWVKSVGFPAIVEKETRELRWVIRSTIFGSVTLLMFVLAALISGNEHWLLLS